MSAETEKLHFKIGLSGTFWDKKPHYTVWLDSDKHADSHIHGANKEIEYIEFDVDLAEGSHEFKIRLENKTNRDTETDGHGNILNDMLLNIESIEVDDIDLGQLLWNASVYVPDHPQKLDGEIVSEMAGCVNLGWTGTYTIKFNSPFYLWLLENI